MTRNIRNRMEVAVPIYDVRIKERILEFLDIMFADDVKIRKLSPDGSYYKLENKENLIAQEKLIEIARKRSEEKNIEETTSKKEDAIGQKRAHKTSKEKEKTFKWKLGYFLGKLFS